MTGTPTRAQTAFKTLQYLWASHPLFTQIPLDCLQRRESWGWTEARGCAHGGRPCGWPELQGQKYLHGHFAAVTAPSAKLAVVPVTPGPHSVVIRQAEGLGISTATGNINHAVALKCLHLPRRGTSRLSKVIQGDLTTMAQRPPEGRRRSVFTKNRSF